MKIGVECIWEIVLLLWNFFCIDKVEFKFVDIYEGIESILRIL